MMDNNRPIIDFDFFTPNIDDIILECAKMRHDINELKKDVKILKNKNLKVVELNLISTVFD